jgi:hypothetical protein
MKKQGVFVVVAAMAVGLLSLVMMTPRANAAQANFPTLARGFSSWLARAMDQCNPSTLSVVTPNLPPGGCPQANVVTDNTLTMRFARVRVSSQGSIGLFGAGFTLGDALRVRLTLRVTKPGIATKHNGINRVTFVDQTVDCPKSPDAYLVRPNGAVAGRTDLAACLAPDSGLSQGNIEIIDAALVNASTGAIVGVPGIFR